ncbi:uncharacterized protein LOC129779450 [Toxorhynchites rutilus septentrionalis]|uniref:uncharacterized protein LOC129779450 n=1 Tax=Toxorhynchites rutilus septentrionalis TaxID=329112 RepID=UPI002478ECC6|nr:uncharacterized protein LOC129779450 [Toxorhynchites rutilus septentrionalis]
MDRRSSQESNVDMMHHPALVDHRDYTRQPQSTASESTPLPSTSSACSYQTVRACATSPTPNIEREILEEQKRQAEVRQSCCTPGLKPVALLPLHAVATDSTLMSAEVSAEVSVRQKIMRMLSAQRKADFMRQKMAEAPKLSDYPTNPNKSRASHVYSPEEAAKREKNNMASRRSRNKKKIEEWMLNNSLQYHLKEIAELNQKRLIVSMEVEQLEKLLFGDQLTADKVLELRRSHGYTESIRSDYGIDDLSAVPDITE